MKGSLIPWIVTLLFITMAALISINIAHASDASIYYVSTSGSDVNSCLSPASPCKTISGALYKASPSSTINITAETYYGTADNVVFIDREINISGGWNQGFTERTGYTTIDGQNSRKNIYIEETINVHLEYLIIQNGYSNSGSGILNYGNLIVDHCIIQNNEGTEYEAGGITNSGILIIQFSSVRNNNGSGIYSSQNGVSAMVINSTISNNINGIGFVAYNQNVIIVNSTISGNINNSWYYDGGGINYSAVNGQKMLVLNSTITKNQAQFSGGGIYSNDTYGGQLILANTIVSGNHASLGPDCVNQVLSQGYNIIGDSSDCTFDSVQGDQLDINPKLGELQDNGGPTYTHWLYQGSPAIDGGNPAGCVDQLGNPLTIDQRGFTRPLDGDEDGTSVCDIGSYEANPDNIPPDPATSWYVSPNGNDSNTCTSPAAPCATINAAVIKSSSGDTIYIASGTYSVKTGNEVVLLNKNSTLSGGWNSQFTQRIGKSIIDGNNQRRVITISDQVTTKLLWVDIRNGRVTLHDGGGIYSGYQSKLTLSNSIVVANMAWNNDPYNPTPLNGGGIAIGTWARLVMNNCLIIGNSASSQGGGIFSADSNIQLNYSTVSYNSAGVGGGIEGFNAGKVELNHTRVNNNMSSGRGGGIDSSSELFVNDSYISGNSAATAGGGIYGNNQITIKRTTINDNQALFGGGIYSNYLMDIIDSSIIHNLAAEGSGGGISSSDNLTLINSTIAYNRAENPITGEADGGGINRVGGYSLQINNVTIARNFAERYGGGIHSNNAQITLRNSLVADNQSATGSDCTGTIHSAGYNLIGDSSGCSFIPTTGDLLDIDPELVRPYGSPPVIILLQSSKAIDGGNPDGCTDELGNPITEDQIGNIRPIDGNEDGISICDIGAFEYNPAAPPRWLYLPITVR